MIVRMLVVVRVVAFVLLPVRVGERGVYEP
jgi:hypothetical protein